MPIDYSKYPPDWPDIRLRILKRSKNRCEQCGVPNGAVGARDRDDQWHDADAIEGMSCSQGVTLWDEYPKIIRIVLTIAHLNHDTTDNRPENLAALCQRCHLRYDAKHHAANARITRLRQKKEQIAATGQLSLPFEEE